MKELLKIAPLQSLEDLFKYVNMANWQFPFFILPNRWIQQQSDGFEKYLSEDGWELPNAWASENRKLDYLSELDLFLNKAASWSEQLAIWKSSKHDSDIQAWHNSEVIEELQVRLDLRGDVRSMALRIVEFCEPRQLSFLILDTATICPPDIFSLIDRALSSRAAKSFKICLLYTSDAADE